MKPGFGARSASPHGSHPRELLPPSLDRSRRSLLAGNRDQRPPQLARRSIAFAVGSARFLKDEGSCSSRIPARTRIPPCAQAGFSR